MTYRRLTATLLLAAALFISGAAEAAPAATASGNYLSVDYVTVSKELNRIEDNLKSGKIDTKLINQYVSYLGDVRSRKQEIQPH